MSLHRAEVSDWDKLSLVELNFWQKLAARTYGIVTPANFISIIGAALVIYGLYAATHDSLTIGVIAILVGRYADVLDGAIADFTKTKSPIGEALDATIDKVLLGLALIVLLLNHLLPLWVGFTMAFYGLCNIVLFAVGRLEKVRLHPSLTGKAATALEWSAVGLYLIVLQLEHQHEHAADIARILANIIFGLFIIFAATAAVNYYRYIYYRKMARG
jgi:phosphatidylglycerophosphate synthase